jgi:hypothetical protein
MTHKALSKADYKFIWDWIHSELSFRPSTYAADWPSIHTEQPFCKFGIGFLWKGEYDEGQHARFIKSAIDAFTDITPYGETIYALDWQHDCFYYDPRTLNVGMLLESESSVQAISFIPDGDYYIFITKNFQNVWFGHPWEKSVTLVGTRLISAAKKAGLPVTC